MIHKKRMTRCPFHDERTPSCEFNPEQDSFHCFGCGKQGKISDYPEHLAKFMGVKAPYEQDKNRLITDLYDDLDMIRIKLADVLERLESLR